MTNPYSFGYNQYQNQTIYQNRYTATNSPQQAENNLSNEEIAAKLSSLIEQHSRGSMPYQLLINNIKSLCGGQIQIISNFDPSKNQIKVEFVFQNKTYSFYMNDSSNNSSNNTATNECHRQSEFYSQQYQTQKTSYQGYTNPYTQPQSLTYEEMTARKNETEELMTMYQRALTSSYPQIAGVLFSALNNVFSEYAQGYLTKEQLNQSIENTLNMAAQKYNINPETIKNTITEYQEKQKAEKAKQEAEIKAKQEAELKGQRTTEFNTAKNTYIKKLQDGNVKDGVEIFNKEIASVENRYINGEIKPENLDAEIKKVYQNTLNEVAKRKDETVKKSVKNKEEKEFGKMFPSDAKIVENKNGTFTVTFSEKDGSQITQNYNELKQLVSESTKDANGKTVETVKYNYNSSYVRTSKVTTRYNNDGSKTVFTLTDSNGAITRKDYDKNGKNVTKTGRSIISAKGGKYSLLTTTELYDTIIKSRKANAGILFNDTVEQIISCYAIGTMTYGQKGYTGRVSYTNILLDAARAGSGKPEGSSTVYSSYSDTGYADFIKNNLEKSLKNDYGYDPEDIKGYLFPSTSNLSKTMAQSKDTKNFVKNNIKDLISGKGLPKTLTFSDTSTADNKDLCYAIHGSNVIDSKLNGRKLELTIYDLYDFDVSYIDKLNSSSGGNTVLNAAGAAAMKDGKMRPYYLISKVTIDLNTIFSDAQLKSMGL